MRVMTANPYQIAEAFAADYRAAEYALKRAGHLRKGIAHAEADWDAFAVTLGASFFEHVMEAGIATTLIGKPPRRLLSTMEWSEPRAVPLANVHELMVMGVCRVRNSYFHGEKFVHGPEGQWARDATLISEAHAVLSRAMTFPG